MRGKSKISPDAVKMRDPPGTVLPFSGQTRLMAADAYLIAMKTLLLVSCHIRFILRWAYLSALIRMTSMYSSSGDSSSLRIARLSSTLTRTSSLLSGPRGAMIPAFAKKKSRWPSSLSARSTRAEMAVGEAASALTHVI